MHPFMKRNMVHLKKEINNSIEMLEITYIPDTPQSTQLFLQQF